MRVSIRWSEPEMAAVVAALEAGAYPPLDPAIASRIRNLSPESPVAGEAGPRWLLDETLQDGQILKEWCDARRARETDADQLMLWTRVVAKVNEGVQLAAPARDQ